MDNSKFLKMYRVQSINLDSKPLLNKSVPIKRVIISNVGKINFNPNLNQYVYFSRTDKHHVYYIFNKILKIIVDQLKKLESVKMYKDIGLPENFDESIFYRNVDWNVIKRVQEFFRSWVTPIGVELVSLTYLNSFSDLINRCYVNNKNKKKGSMPEISDTKFYQGAYGLNGDWLDLLKCVTVSTTTTNLYLDKFFEFYIGASSYRSAAKVSIKGILKQHPRFFDILEDLTYNELENPDFVSKNNVNNIVKNINQIYLKNQFNPKANLTEAYFNQVKKEIKTDIEEYKMEI